MKKVLFIIFSCLLICSCDDYKKQKNNGLEFSKMKEEEIYNLLSKKFPTGSELKQVKVFLEKNKINYGFNDKENKIFIRKEVGGDLFVKKSIYIHFFFNKKDKLTKIKVGEWLTGP